jgi:addiction module HigA family antidote
VKRESLLRHLRLHGCYLKREGGSHSLWCNPITGQTEAIPRHTEVADLLAEDLQGLVGSGDRTVTERMHNPPHPGRIIKEAIESIPMSVTGFAAHIGVSRVALSRVLNERAGVTPEMSIKISEAFGQDSPDIWFNIQNDYDFWQASRAKTGRKKVEPLQSAAA